MRRYLKSLYTRTMDQAYDRAIKEILQSLDAGGRCLDCGAQEGAVWTAINRKRPLESQRYVGVEWNHECARAARRKGLSVVQADLNTSLPFEDGSFQCVIALSVLEHLINGCRFLAEARRVLAPSGHLVVLTPNISTPFTIFQLLTGKMPSSGPHPDSDQLVASESPPRVSDVPGTDMEASTSVTRHMVVFSFRVLRRYLKIAGFSTVRGFAFGLYPFPNFMQPLLEAVDPYHCHQMVMTARK